jgi:pimeloyl-ACP methyl ester carboxylesterase
MTARDGDAVLRLADGRALGYRIYGDPAGPPLLFLHGTPGSRLKLALADRAARGLGLALIAPDRWGYGLTDMASAPSLSAFAADMGALMDHLGHARFAVGGISGGGPYAAAAAAHLGTRVTALALVSPMGPVAGEACRHMLSPYQRVALGTLPRAPLAVAAAFRLFRLGLAHAPRLAAHLATLRAGPRDKALIADPEIAAHLLGSFLEGLRPGTAGPITDLQLFTRPWDLALAAITAPARVWIGTADTAVPIGGARLLAQSIPGCVLTELEGEGHFWLAADHAEVLAWIVTTWRAGAGVGGEGVGGEGVGGEGVGGEAAANTQTSAALPDSAVR